MSTPYALVVVAGASNVTGEVWPLERVVDTARAHGARVALDAAQLAPHRRVDLAGTGVDWVALSGHKLYAPYGAGALVGRADWLDEATPYLRGGGATARVTPLGTTWARGAARHEAGSPNVIGAIALAAACATIERHRDAVEAHEQDLLDRLRDGLGAVPGVDTWTIFGDDPQVDRVGVVAFTVDRLDSALVSAVLSAEHGIGVRDGRFCAHVLVDDLLTDPWGDVPGTAVRASVGLGDDRRARRPARRRRRRAGRARPAASLGARRAGVGGRRRRARDDPAAPLVTPAQGEHRLSGSDLTRP